MTKLSASLTFNGQCEAAFKFYEKCLGGKITLLMTWGESPMGKEVPKEWAKKVIHVSFALGDQHFIGGDSPPGSYVKPQGFSVVLGITDTREAERVFKALAEKGSIQMPIQETFWAARFGMVVDQFGTPWMINCAKPS